MEPKDYQGDRNECLKQENEQSVESNQNSNTFPMEKVTLEMLEHGVEASKKKLNEEKFDEAIEDYREWLQKGIAFHNDEMAYPLFKFYLGYGHALLSRLEHNMEIFGDVLKKEDEEEEDQAEALEQQEEQKQGEQHCSKEKIETEIPVLHTETMEMAEVRQISASEANREEKKQNQNQDTTDDDYQLAWENLEVARVIVEKHINLLKSEHKNEEDKDLIQNMKNLAKIKLRLGDLENLRERYEEALKEYYESLELRLKCEDNNYSRELSEVYFLIGNNYLYLGKDDCEDRALHYFNESRIIMENVLREALALPRRNIFGIEGVLDRGLIKDLEGDNAQVKEFKAILHMLYDKIEDTVLQKTEKDKFKKETQKMKEVAVIENKFTNAPWGVAQNSGAGNGNPASTPQNGFSQAILSQDPSKKVINLGVVGNAKRKTAEEPTAKPAIAEKPPMGTESLIEEKENIGVNLTSGEQSEQNKMERLEIVTKVDEDGIPEKKLKLN